VDKNYLNNVSKAAFAAGLNAQRIRLAAQILKRARMIWIVGNGGSAATASHFASDLTKAAGLLATSLPDQTPIITAYGNDTGWENMYASFLLEHMQEKDVLVAISCSGNSANILRAAEAAIGKLVVLTGRGRGNALAGMDSAVCICVDHADIRVQEDIHLAICHMIAGEIGIH